jgi:glycosyltransferase involved in cell wall biosynthesis
VSQLGSLGHKVIVLSCTEETEGAQDEALAACGEHNVELISIPVVLTESTLQRKARSLRRPHSELLRVRTLRERLEVELRHGYDVLHLEQLFTGWLGLGVPRSVVFVHSLDTVDWSDRTDLTPRQRVDLFQIKRATRRLVTASPRIVVNSDRMRREIERYGGRRVSVAPLALDISQYAVLDLPGRSVVGVIGSMNWFPSRSAAERVITRLWPAVLERVPNAQLLVAGWNAERYLGHLFPVRQAHLLGSVAAPSDFFGAIDVLLYPPPRGTGMKIKVLEAMAYGVPVVSNAEGLEGLDGAGKPPAIQGETDELLISAVERVLTDDALRTKLRQDGRAFVAAMFNPVIAVDRLIGAYRELGLLA